MKFLEGKSQAERKKIITALILGVVTISALFYTFVLSGSGSAKGNKNGNSNLAAGNANSRRSNSSAQQISQVEPQSIDETLLMPIPDNPFPPISSGAVARNIFAFYEPPPPGPPPTPKPAPPTPTPTPAPPPPIFVAGMNPGTVFARTGNLTLEVGGDKFTPDSKVFFGGMMLPTKFVSPQRLTAQVPAEMIASDGERDIMVREPNNPPMHSNSVKMNVQVPPEPEFNFVGLVARQRANNDTALLQNKKTKEYISVRLNDTVPDRFRVFSISSKEVVVVDTALKLRHVLGFVEEKDAPASIGGGIMPSRGREGVRGRMNQQPNPSYNQPAPNVQYQPIPGIPDNIPRYVPPQPPQTPPQPSKKNDEDEDDNDPNR